MLHDHAGRDLAQVARQIAAVPRLLLACDFDGTISPIVGHPEQARPLPGAMAALQGLAALPATHVALISGRARSDLAERCGAPAGVMLVGSHGAEWGSDFAEGIDPARTRLLRAITRQAESIVADAPGAMVEKKPASVAVHVRRASRPDADRVVAAVLAGPATAQGVGVIHGKEVVELTVAGSGKGAAISRLRAQFDPTASVYLGDDVTDEAAFAELLPQDFGIKVGEGVSLAALRIDDPNDAVLLLAAVLHRRRAPGAAPRPARPTVG